MEKHNLFAVILAGGAGTRLWPISRQANPKQFIEVGQEKSLLEQAIDRASLLVKKENIWICTTLEHEEKIARYFGYKIGKIVTEPCSGNTAPAILLSCLQIYKLDQNSTILFLPADPFIPDSKKFVQYLTRAINFAKTHEKITLVGIKPTHPATGYGYIQYKAKKIQSSPWQESDYEKNILKQESLAYKVIKFHEKPDLQTAQKYIKQENIIWNIGTFCAKTKVFIREFQINAPEIFAGVSNYLNGIASYSQIPSDSIDFAVIEKSKNIFVVPADFAWHDVGNIEVFLSIQKKYTQLDQNVISVNSKNNLVKIENKLVALVGINDLCIIETEDIILIAKKQESEQVKEIVRLLKEQNNTKYL